jgi:hypothetical protein
MRILSCLFLSFCVPVPLLYFTALPLSPPVSHRGLGIQQRSGGNIYNVTYRNIEIETRCWTLGWWGAGEPIWISSVARQEPIVPTGRIYDISFYNISAVSENNAMVSGRPNEGGNVVSGITVHNVSITLFQYASCCFGSSPHCLSRWTNYTCAYRDYRPSVEPQIVFDKINILYLEHVNGFTTGNTSATFSVPRQKYWAECLSTTDCEDIDTSSLQCLNGISPE